MKTPSKLADALSHHVSNRSNDQEVDFVVNVLADTQANLAASYATPGTPPLAHPQKGKLEGELHPLEEAGLIEVKGGSVPLVKGAVGAFGCQVVVTVDLSKYGEREVGGERSKSVLYIARVVHVYSDGEEKKPLIYCGSKFITTSNTPLP